MSRRYIENVFYSFRGSSESPEAAARQIEDNLTKALVNTLAHTRGVLTAAMLRKIGVEADAPAGFVYDLQTPVPPGLLRCGPKTHRVLLGIVSARASAAEPTSGSRPSATGRGRPDAWICGRDLMVLVESKIGGGQLDADQLDRHSRLLEEQTPDGERPVVRKTLTWAEIYDVTSETVAGRSEASVDSELGPHGVWLAKQFLGYLEMTNMSGFVGFKSAVFDYFFEPTQDSERSEDSRIAVRDAFEDFCRMFAARLAQIDPFYEEVDLGKLQRKQSFAWAAFGPKRGLRERAHLTVSLNSKGMLIKVNIENKPAIERLRRALGEDAAGFQAALRALAVPERDADGKPFVAEGGRFVVAIEERVQLQVQNYVYFPRAQFDVNTLGAIALGDDGYAFFRKLVRDIELPYVTLQTELDRGVVEAYSSTDRGQPLVECLAKIAARLHPIVQFANGRSSQENS